MAQFVCRYRKDEKVRWISHLDLKRTIERAMRRAELPLELTQGHNPHPKMSLGPPLPMGATGEAELLAFHLAQPADPAQVKERLNIQLPPGLEISEVWLAPAQKKKETFGEVDLAEYLITVTGPANADQVRADIAKLLAAGELTVHRGGERPERDVDLLPLIHSLEVVRASESELVLQARLKTGSHGGARPQEIAELLGIDKEDRVIRYHRTGLFAGAEVTAPRSRGVWRRWSRSRGGRGGERAGS